MLCEVGEHSFVYIFLGVERITVQTALLLKLTATASDRA